MAALSATRDADERRALQTHYDQIDLLNAHGSESWAVDSEMLRLLDAASSTWGGPSVGGPPPARFSCLDFLDDSM
jgi:hypothetical protein